MRWYVLGWLAVFSPQLFCMVRDLVRPTRRVRPRRYRRRPANPA